VVLRQVRLCVLLGSSMFPLISG